MTRWLTLVLAASALVAAAPPPVPRAAAVPQAGLAAALDYPFASDLTGVAGRIAWLSERRGVRSVWTAAAPGWQPRRVWQAAGDDGQELTGLVLSPDGRQLLWVRGGDHGANWDAEGGLQPDAGSTGVKQMTEVWTAPAAGGPARKVGDGDGAVTAAGGRIAFLRDGQVWATPADGRGEPARLFFDRGRPGDLAWSPDGRRLAFTSGRGDHALIGIWSGADAPIAWIAPGTARDFAPVWSPDGTRIAFLRRPGRGGPPEPLLSETRQPWAIVVADARTGAARTAWVAPDTDDGSFPEVPGGVLLDWAAGDRLIFRAEQDGWAHLWSVPAAGGAATLLTPGDFMVEQARLTDDRRHILYSANTGTTPDDIDRRHLFRVGVEGGAPVALTEGTGLEWGAVPAGGAGVAYVAATTARPGAIRMRQGTVDRAVDPGPGPFASSGGSSLSRPVVEKPVLDGRVSTGSTLLEPNGSALAMVVPRAVTFRAADGLMIHGQLFDAGGAGPRPAMVFAHGGPSRQMLLGWHNRRYYAHAYAMNQYLARRGFVVLAVNYRLGIGYGRAFQHAAKGGPAGASEYQDVVAAGRWLRALPQVDGKRIGIWGGSYGGLLTALGLARDSGLFAAGVDLHGVHDWSLTLGEEVGAPLKRYERGDWDAALKTAFAASPVADVATWTSPVLLIHGDDDRNVRINQTIDLSRRLAAKGVAAEELLIPNEVHDMLRHRSWLAADTAMVRFLDERLAPPGAARP